MSKFGNGCSWWSGVLIAAVVCGLWAGPNGRALAADRDPRVQAAINKGMAFLRKEIGNLRGGRKSLAALALIKGGDAPTSPAIQL